MSDKMKIYQDANGVELKRESLTKGRHPWCATKDNDGNVIVKGCTKDATGNVTVPARPVEPKTDIYYITLNVDGTEKSRKLRGKGRPPKGFELQKDGEFAGHFTKVETPVVETVENTTTETPVEETTSTEAVVA